MARCGNVQRILLFLLVSVPFSVAVRKGLSASGVPPTTATHVMSKVNLLLREKSLQSHSKRRAMRAIHLSTQRAIDKETPGPPDVRSSLSETLRSVIDQIKINLDAKIKRDHDNTQDVLNKRVDHVNLLTERASGAYQEAVSVDDDWLACVTEEKTRLEAFEQAQADLETAQGIEQEARGRKQDATPFSKAVPLSLLSLRCSPGQDAGCASSIQALHATLEQYHRDLDSEVSESKHVYTEAKEALEAAEEQVGRRESDVTNTETWWKEQGNMCENKEQRRSDHLCRFGHRLQLKCKEIEGYHGLTGEIDGDRGTHSHSLRVEQWTASHITQCLLNKVISDFQIDQEALSECEGTVDFGADVGELARRGDEVEQAATSAAVACEDTQVKFNGWTWEVPRGVDNIRSDQYKRVEDWQPELTVTDDHPAFDFCDA